MTDNQKLWAVLVAAVAGGNAGTVAQNLLGVVPASAPTAQHCIEVTLCRPHLNEVLIP